MRPILRGYISYRDVLRMVQTKASLLRKAKGSLRLFLDLVNIGLLDVYSRRDKKHTNNGHQEQTVELK